MEGISQISIPSIFIKHNLILSLDELDVTDLPKIKIVLSPNIPQPNFNLDIHDMVIKYKSEIENIPSTKLWDKSKKISNDFELIYVSRPYNMKVSGVSDCNPLSRSFFKLW